MKEYNHNDLMELAGYMGMDYEARELFGVLCQEQLVLNELMDAPQDSLSLAQLANKTMLRAKLIGDVWEDDYPVRMIDYRSRAFIVEHLPLLLAAARAKHPTSST